jgi:aminopeptidase YwaD
MTHRPISTVVACALLLGGLAQLARAQTSDPPPLLPEPVVRALAAEVSGAEARRTAQDLTLFHRMRGSRGYRAAAERVRDRLRQYGLAEVQIIELPADGRIFYGTQRSRPAWDADFAELWEQERAGEAWVDARRIASYDLRPVTLAQDSGSGAVTAELVDVGAGTSEQDYAGKDVRGKLVLVAAQPGPAVPLAVDRYGAAGIVSYAQNQQSAWWKEDETLVRWGHLASFPAPKTFAFMVSLRQARDWQERLAQGQAVRLRAEVRAGQHPGSYDIVSAVIPGADPALRSEEIVLSCHLDHLRPGANDNASGCAAILEVARTLSRLIRDKEIPAPRRTIRFVWPPEIEGTIALLNARPEIPRQARAVIHMDMVGGGPVTQAVFHLTRSPKSLPTFVNDVSEALGRFVNEQTERFADSGSAVYPLVDPEGGKQALQAAFVDFSEGSDHQVWTEGSWRVPAIYLNDWPDRYIHTDGDEIGNLDATKLLRAAFLGAASAWYLADLDAADVPALWQVMQRHALERTARALGRRERLRAAGQPEEGENLLRFHWASERAAVDSIRAFAKLPPEVAADAESFLAALKRLVGGGRLVPATSHPAADVVYSRAPEPKGPMSGFGYEYLADKRQALSLPVPALANWSGPWGGGSDYLYEALNLVDGKRTVRQIRDDLSAIYGPVPIERVAEFLDLLRRIGVLGR